MHFLAPALILTLALTLTLNHLVNKPQQTTSTLFDLMYQTTEQQTINIFTTDKWVVVTQESRAHSLLPYVNMSECSDSLSYTLPGKSCTARLFRCYSCFCSSQYEFYERLMCLHSANLRISRGWEREASTQVEEGEGTLWLWDSGTKERLRKRQMRDRARHTA